MKDMRIKQVFHEGGYQKEWERHKERLDESKDGRYILYSHIKIEE
jgi:hypothetical protein